MNRREALKQSGLIVGYTLSASTLSQLWTACKSEPQLTWTPQFFTEAQASTVSAMAECILPRTETPGAKDLGIDQYIDVFVKNIYSAEDQQAFVQGMKEFEESCRQAYGKTFANLNPEEQEAFLLDQEQEANMLNHAIWGEVIGEKKPVSFYRQFKAMLISGYFSSEEVGKNLLTYEPVPGSQQGCIPLSEVGNVYSL
ncbi:gluconate 2-dehydrogenase subunit 3 family protein [Catalinimonas niigatensis]|uniref:gluconate 2-dehydrogenase subunit 3 family protein n=1 Tax=Catalinimonas niigatensis TaxID=1397264 RepID=UPI002665D803|nr:gluconate 2-dehydrogenase subunit 3 family protein [Catalinimonas niigatensis]WPP48411.1 gluconate 2-dehydrogenase subunit 3 family protein [Catalinimonas niigatensis]